MGTAQWGPIAPVASPQPRRCPKCGLEPHPYTLITALPLMFLLNVAILRGPAAPGWELRATFLMVTGGLDHALIFRAGDHNSN